MNDARRARKPAARKPKSARSVEIAKIHIGATDRHLIDGVDDSAYRDMLWSVARVRSAKDLDANGRRAVLDHLRAIGWVDSSPPRRGLVRAAGLPQVEKLRALWRALGDAGHLQKPGDDGLRAFVRKQSATYHPQRIGFDAPELLPAPVASKLIEHLKRWCQRTGTVLPE